MKAGKEEETGAATGLFYEMAPPLKSAEIVNF
jgi:hypothetical protein